MFSRLPWNRYQRGRPGRGGRLWVSVLLFLLPTDLYAQALPGRVVEHTLQNGIKVIMLRRAQAPVISFQITYRVGSVHEQTGMTGAAHLYEHMAFKGTERIGTIDRAREAPLLEAIEERYHELTRKQQKRGTEDAERVKTLKQEIERLEHEAQQWVKTNELGELYERHGAVDFNASTSRDVTSYTVALPANRLPLWVAIESDRMAHPVMREFYKEREVVLEERHRSVESSPIGKLREAFYAAAFLAHPYGHPTLGWPSDIRAVSARQIAEFFKTYYGPQNTILTLVGDLEPERVLPVLEAAFGAIPAGAEPPHVVTVEPPQTGERRIAVEAEAEPQLMIGFHQPGILHADDAVFDVIDSLLSDGRTSRLYQALVDEKKVAVSVGTHTGSPGAQYPHLFTIAAVPQFPHTTEEVEAAVYTELEKLANEPVSAAELKKVLTRMDAGLLRSMQSNEAMSSLLGYFEAITGSWRYLIANREAIAAVTPEEIMRVAKTYFTKKNRVVATLLHSQSF